MKTMLQDRRIGTRMSDSESAERWVHDILERRLAPYWFLLHDLKTPLTAMKCSLDLVSFESRNRLSPRHQEFLRQANRCIDVMNGLLESVLLSKRLEDAAIEPKSEPVDLGTLAAEIAAFNSAEALATGQSLTIERTPGAPVVVRADADLLRRVVWNLVANAVKLVPAGGRIVVSAGIEESGVGRISVRDTGPGIEPDLLEAILRLDASASIRREGLHTPTQFGLRFCKLATEAMDGTLTIDSTPGAGTAVHVDLPLAVAEK